MRRSLRLMALLAAAGATMTSAARGADPPAPPQEVPVPPEAQDPSREVRVIGSKADSLQRVPGSGTLITEREIERAKPYDTAEVLRRVPGVQVRQDYGGGNRIDISIRGLEGGRARKVLLLEDGIPLALNPYAESDVYFAPAVERVRGIEVVKGSGNILFGPQTLGGVINFITVAPPEGTRVMVDAEGGQRGYARGLASYGDNAGGVRTLVQVMKKRGDGFRGIGFNVTDVLGKLAFDTSSKGDLTLKLTFHDERNDSDAIGLTREMAKADPRRAKLAENDKTSLQFYQVGAIHEQRLTRTIKLRTLAYAYRTDRVWRRQDYTRSPRADEDYERVVGDPSQPNGAIYFQNANTILDRSYEVAGVEPRLESRFSTGNVAHTVDVGARLLYETARYAQRSGQDPFTWTGALDNAESHDTLATAAYIQDRIAFRDDLLVTPGIRFERARFRRDVLRQLGPSGPVDVRLGGSTNTAGVIPGIGMVYGSRRASFFGGLHVGWAPPRVVSSVSARGAPSEVSAEESINYELGTRLAPAKWLKAEAAGFLSNFRNQVVFNTSGAASAGEQVNGGPTRIVGLESAAGLALGTAFGWPTALDLSARYTLARATFVQGVNDGRSLPYAPLHNASFHVDVEHPSGFGAQVAWTHTGPMVTDVLGTLEADTTGRVGQIPARNVVDVSAHYAHRPSGLSIRVAVKNATDDLYVASRRPEGIFVSGFRQIIVGIRWVFETKENR